MDLFESCRQVNDFLMTGDERAARDALIQILDQLGKEGLPCDPLVNHLIRETGLYPYLKVESADWQDRFIYEAFRTDVGRGEFATLHREQAGLLNRLLSKEDIAVSAPTSFGKSFVIDAYIANAKPANVVIIVPTIALTDETRRRLYRKFSDQYTFITTTNVPLRDRNIFIFPAERAINYVDKIEAIDILIIDEFYKASADFDSERSPALLRAILKLKDKAKQRYYLAPNINELSDSVFTAGMTFHKLLDFNTVFLEKHELYPQIRNESQKSKALLEILSRTRGKTLIYAGSHPEIKKVTNLLLENLQATDRDLPNRFAQWLARNYDDNWSLSSLARRGCGVHNGALHRSLGQIQIRLFEEAEGFDKIISTSSIIEGVNTSAENIVLWRSKIGIRNLNDFTYKNIIGRGGRMFRHFVGQIFLLEEPPDGQPTELNIPFPDQILGDLDEAVFRDQLTPDQMEVVVGYKEEMYGIMGKNAYDELVHNSVFQVSNFDLLKQIALSIKDDPGRWRGLAFFHSDNPDDWEPMLYKILRLQGNAWETTHRTFVTFVKLLSKNWTTTVGEMLGEMSAAGIGIDDFFKFERNVAFKLSALLGDVNELYKAIVQDGTDISDFVFKLSHAFLPPVVYELEEYGLPRMISKKIHSAGMIDFTNRELTIHEAIERLNAIGKVSLLGVRGLDDFDDYIIEYFYDGITLESSAVETR